MAAGAPLVASQVGGIPEMVETERQALLVADRDAVAHLAAVERLLDDRELAQRLGKAARARVEWEFNADRMAASSIGIYREVASRQD